MLNSKKNLTKPSTKDCLNLANSLIKQCNLSIPHVNHVAEINFNLISSLYEAITKSPVPDLIFCDHTVEEEAHNVQAVINSLSLDILYLSLSHITGDAVVGGDVVSICNLLHVLEGILLHSSKYKHSFPKRKIIRLERNKSKVSNENTCKQPKLSSTLDIEKLFEKNVELKLGTKLVDRSLRSNSFLKEKNYQLMTKPMKKSTHPPSCHKSYLLPYPLRKKRERPLKNIISTKEPTQEEETVQKRKRSPLVKTNFIQELLEEFPGIQLSPVLLRNLEDKYAQQLIRMDKLMKECLSKKSKAFVEVESISERQLKLMNLLKKDTLEQLHLKQVREEKENEGNIKYSLRDSRLKSARMKQYSEEFIQEVRRKMLKPNTAEEMIFRNVFKETMDIQNEHVTHLCQQVREARSEDDEQYLNYLKSLENLYQSQYLVLSEEITNEKNDAQLRLNAERQALLKTEREFRETLKNEIRFMQKVIVDQTADCHFREMDAAMYIEEKRKQLF